MHKSFPGLQWGIKMENIDFSQLLNSKGAIYASLILVALIARMLFVAFKKALPIGQSISLSMQDSVMTNKQTAEAIKEQTLVIKEMIGTMKNLATKEDVLSMKEYILRNSLPVDPINRQAKNG